MKFVEKPMEVDTDPFITQANYVELVHILMVDVVLEDNCVQPTPIFVANVVPKVGDKKNLLILKKILIDCRRN